MNFNNRLIRLEGKLPQPAGTWHRIIQHEGQTLHDALAIYGPDRITARDNVIVRRMIGSVA